jgi:integrase
MTIKVDEDPKFQIFLKRKKRKEQTIARYTRELTLYSESTGMSLSKLIAEARDEQLDPDKPWMDDRQLEPHLLNFIQFMESRNYSPLRIQNAIRIIRSFYKNFQIVLPDTPYKAEPKNFHQEADDLPGKHDIKTAMNLSNLKWRGIISLMASSGLSMVDVRELKVSDFLKGLGVDDPSHIPQISEVGDRIPCLKLVRVKTTHPFVTFCSTESRDLILTYLQLHPPENENDYLFRSNKGTKLFSSQFQHQFAFINKAAGWNKTGYTWYFTTRTLRKYFANTLEGLIPHRDIRRMMGHKQDDVTQSYFKQHIPTLLESYKKGMPELTFIERATTVEKDLTKYPEYIQMQEEIHRLSQENKLLSKKMDQWMEEQKRFEEYLEKGPTITKFNGEPVLDENGKPEKLPPRKIPEDVKPNIKIVKNWSTNKY